MKNVLKIVFVIIGTTIGAGFASGQEIYLFFNKYGFMGIIGISEGAIPFAASDPIHVFPATIAGSAVTGGFSAACGVTSAVPHGGLVVALFKATNYMSLYLLSVILGTAVSAAIVLAFKKKQNFR